MTNREILRKLEDIENTLETIISKLKRIEDTVDKIDREMP